MLGRIDRIIDKLKGTKAGREAIAAVEAEDLGARQVHAQALADADRWLTATLEQLDHRRRDAEARFEAARREYEPARDALAAVDRDIQAARFEADRRRNIVRRELAQTAPSVIDASLDTLRELLTAVRREFHVWEGTERDPVWGGRRLRVVSNAEDLAAVIAAIRTALERVEALRFEALPADELNELLRRMRADIEHAGREHAIPLAWPGPA